MPYQEALTELELALSRLNSGDLSVRLPEQEPTSPSYRLFSQFNQLAATLESGALAKRMDQEGFLARILSHVPIDMAIFDRSFRYVFVNRSAIKDDQAREWIIGKTDLEYCEHRGIDPSVALKRQALYQQVLQTKAMVSLREDRTNPNGEVFAFLRTLSPVFDGAGEIELLIGCGIEITSLALSEKELRRKNEDLDKTNRELDHFVYRTSHEMRGPIASILGLLGLIEGEDKSAGAPRFLQLIGNSAVKLDTFIREIVDFSTNARTESKRSAICWDEIVNAAFLELGQLDPSHPIELKFHLEGNDEFVGDALRIKMLVFHILSNSVKYFDPQKERSWASVNVRQDEREAVITLSDNGKGIAKEHQSRLFDMFFRATHDAFGSGLGLYIVSEVLAKLKGRVEVESELGVGTAFTITIPAGQPE